MRALLIIPVARAEYAKIETAAGPPKVFTAPTADLKWSDAEAYLETNGGKSGDLKDKVIPGVKCTEAKTVNGAADITYAAGSGYALVGTAATVALGTVATAGDRRVDLATNNKLRLDNPAVWREILKAQKCTCEDSRPHLVGLTMDVPQTEIGTTWSPCQEGKKYFASGGDSCDEILGIFDQYDYKNKKCYACTKVEKDVISPECPGSTPVCQAGDERKCVSGHDLLQRTKGGIRGFDADGKLGPCTAVWSANGHQTTTGTSGTATHKEVCACNPGYFYVGGAGVTKTDNCAKMYQTVFAEGSITLSAAKSKAQVENDMHAALAFKRASTSPSAFETATTASSFESWAGIVGRDKFDEVKKSLPGLEGTLIKLDLLKVSNADNSAVAEGESLESLKKWNYQFLVYVSFGSQPVAIANAAKFGKMKADIDMNAALNNIAATVGDYSALKGAKFGALATSSASSLAAVSALVALLVVNVL